MFLSMQTVRSVMNVLNVLSRIFLFLDMIPEIETLSYWKWTVNVNHICQPFIGSV